MADSTTSLTDAAIIQALRRIAKLKGSVVPVSSQQESPKSQEPVTLPFATGLELTAVYKYHQEVPSVFSDTHVDPATVHYIEYVANILKQMHHYKDQVAQDYHCVEWKTPVYKDWITLQEDVERFRRNTENYTLVPRHPATVCGGGHIHLDLPSMKARNRFRDLVFSCPAIPWVFLSPDDTESANNPTLCRREGLKRSRYNNKPRILTEWHKSKEYAVCQGGKAEDSCRRTVECRFFEAAEDWEEQKLHLDFAYALAAFASDKKNKIPSVILYTPPQLQRIKCGEAIVMFGKLCELIGFDYTRCIKQIDRNLIPRWNRGYERT